MSEDLRTRKSLLARLRNGSNNGDWEAFYRQYNGVILSFCRRQGLDECDASDVLQETMMLLIRKLPQFDYDPQKGLFRNWLLTLVAGKVRDAYRRARRAQFVSISTDTLDQDVFPDLFTGENVACDAMEMSWMQAVVEEALQRLRSDDRIKPETFAAFQAYVIEGKPVAEVARQFSLNENAVYQLKNRLLRRLHKEVSILV